LPVSTTISPVTQVAEVAVKRASRGLVYLPGAVETGKSSSVLPMAIITRKVTTTVKGGERERKEKTLFN